MILKTLFLFLNYVDLKNVGVRNPACHYDLFKRIGKYAPDAVAAAGKGTAMSLPHSLGRDNNIHLRMAEL